MALLRADVDAAGASDARVLVTGETGTGKEIVAQLLHARSSRRASSPLVALNCAGLPEGLAESWLFGHERGSFTGADGPQAGVLASADGGTVFLDEVGELTAHAQSLLLRFLDDGEIQRVGASAPTRVDVRIIAATNTDLASAISGGTFRRDLYYRLNVLRLRTTALRERREDIPVLLAHFLGLYAAQARVSKPALTAPAVDRLVQYDWPGNVRQLRNVAERLVAAGRPVGAADIPTHLWTAAATAARTESAPASSVVEELYGRMCTGGESFWATVHPRFMARDLTREDLRALITRGLEVTGGDYRLLLRLFNIETRDYSRFLAFLRRFGCAVGDGPVPVAASARAVPDTEDEGR